MPDDSDHINVALHNIDTINYLLAKPGFSDWGAVVVFYTALHIVDAVLFCDPRAPIKHGSTHSDRRDVLKGITHYEKIYQHYSIIWRVSNIARYLEDKNTGNVVLFNLFMPPKKVKDELINHHLQQVINSSSNFLPPKLAEQIKQRFNSYFSETQPQTEENKKR